MRHSIESFLKSKKIVSTSLIFPTASKTIEYEEILTLVCQQCSASAVDKATGLLLTRPM